MTNIVVFLIFILLLALWLILGRPKPRVSVSIALSLFIISLFGSVWVSYNPLLSWPALLYLMGNIGLCLAIALVPFSPRWIAILVVILNSLIAFYFIAQYVHFGYQREVVGMWGELGRLTGSLLPPFVFFIPHPNVIASLLEGAFVLSLGFLWGARRKRRWLWGILAALMAYALLISGSRGAWLGLLVVLGIGAILLLPKQIRWPAAGMLGLVTSIVLSLFFLSQQTISARPIANLGSSTSHLPSRFLLYRNAIYLLSDYPFSGIGLGDTFAQVYSHYQLLIEPLFLRQTHNLFLSIWLGQGFLGVVALVWLLIEFYRFIIRVERIGLVNSSMFLFRGAWLGTTAILLHSLTDNAWTLPMQFIMLGLTLAFGRTILARYAPRRTRQKKSRPNPYQKRVLLVISVVVLATIALFMWQPLAGAWYANLGAISQTRADLSPQLDETSRKAAHFQAIQYFERALRFHPTQTTANRRLGTIALEKHDFDTALTYLEQSYSFEPKNQATLKLLGYAYLWTGQLDISEKRFREVEAQEELIEELTHYWWWWGTQHQPDLSEYANQMRQRFITNTEQAIPTSTQSDN